MSETVVNRTTSIRPDHTRWECKRTLQDGMRQRDRNCLALTDKDFTLGSRVGEEDGLELWCYVVVSNGYH
ncbi:hypothetical protein HYE67_008083 [Fusarium culmorum]|uniref:Uncharacterized protein n=1 Tax=Fusarium culmorum TaxID=5516 RepID=A0A2T4H7V0_FUSCU|nr:hypothetical protein FCULG_00002758 [Fusarium culmorum]QPC65852.1 hypothetical protein HYE67_008083 [Fusarium culmorum]